MVSNACPADPKRKAGDWPGGLGDPARLNWTQRESVRADHRRHVRRLLAKYGYPPDLSEDATQPVLKQAELDCRWR
jgi:hypothetical protein